MGVPKFFRWISERYPKINQRYGSPPNPETSVRYFDVPPPPPFEEPDPLSTCGLPPEIDRLYLDMNGIIHGCSHNNDDDEEQEGGNDNDDGGDMAGPMETILNDEGEKPSKNNGRQRPSRRQKQQRRRRQAPKLSNEEIFRNVCYYLDRLVGDMVQPKELVYMAIDGVAPRAKLNQQRSRRYRTGREGEIEMNIYEAHAKALSQEEERRRQEQQEEEEEEERNRLRGGYGSVSDGDAYSFVFDYEEGNSRTVLSSSSMSSSFTTSSTTEQSSTKNDDTSSTDLKEVSPGRFKGKFETHAVDDEDETDATVFHSTVITPGTNFFAEFTRHLEHFVKYKMSTDAKWKDLTIIFSGSNVPGEGEHKIMDFIREQKGREDYDPNLRHCIMGQDGDLIMLGLATHEPNMVLLRERVVFNLTKQRLQQATAANSLDSYIHNAHFEFLHMGVLRDYLAYEFETSNVVSGSPWDLERTIDDFVFMTFFVGNDFLPHMPALDIGDNAFDLLFITYKTCRREWQRRDPYMPYLTNLGTIVSGRRLEEFLSVVGSHEVAYYDRKKQSAESENKKLRKVYKRFGMSESAIPDLSLVESKEATDRAAYRKMLQDMGEAVATASVDVGGARGDTASSEEGTAFMPVMTGEVEFEPIEEEFDEGLISRMGSLLQNSLSTGSGGDGDDDVTKYQLASIDDQDLKGRYYYDKFQFTPFDAEKHLALRKAYVEGLVWNLKYYYEGCVSWEWYFPYHYGPMLSDLVNLDDILDQINFDDKLGAPLTPFQQLLGCMPPSQAHWLPEPYRWLMIDPQSPIYEFYPESFTVDMNGKRWPWEAVALLPFIDSERLIQASLMVDQSLLTQEERERNKEGTTVVISHDPSHNESIPGIGTMEGFQQIEVCQSVQVPYDQSNWHRPSGTTKVSRQVLNPNTKYPLAGFGTLRDAPVQSLWRRKLGINVFGSRSRYKTSCLEISSLMPPLPPIQVLAPKLIGTSVFVNYPYFVEALVTAVSDENFTVRGKNETREWNAKESSRWRYQRDGVVRRDETGEGYPGTGGLIVPSDQAFTVSVRPLQGLVTTRDGKVAKSYAKFEIEIPLISTLWGPSMHDSRLIGIPSRLEKNAYEVAKALTNNSTHVPERRHKFPKKGVPKRRKLLPAKPHSVKGLMKQEHMDVSNDVSKVAAAYYSSLHSDSNGIRNNAMSFSRLRRALPSLPNTFFRDGGKTFSTMSRSAWTQPQQQPRFSSISSLTYLEHTTNSVISGSNTLRLSSNEQNARNIFRPVPLSSSWASTHAAVRPRHVTGGSGPRGRIVAAGLSVLALLWIPTTNATTTTTVRSSFTRPNATNEGWIPWKGRIPVDTVQNQQQSQSSDYSAVWPATELRGGDVLDVDGHGFVPLSLPSSTPPLQFAHGTTTLAFTFRGGIIAAVDSRASMGNFVGSKTTKKVLPVSTHILGTMAGGAADCQRWIRYVKKEALLHELTTEDGRRMSVARASRILSNVLYQLRGSGLSVGTMIMGYDDIGDHHHQGNDDDVVTEGESDGGAGPPSSAAAAPASVQQQQPHIYYVDDMGVRIRGDLFAVGSGSTFALGILDTATPDRYNTMTVEEAIDLGIRAIRHATFRDAYSGGYINVYLITPQEGWKKVYTEDIARTPEVWKALQE